MRVTSSNLSMKDDNTAGSRESRDANETLPERSAEFVCFSWISCSARLFANHLPKVPVLDTSKYRYVPYDSTASARESSVHSDRTLNIQELCSTMFERLVRGKLVTRTPLVVCLRTMRPDSENPSRKASFPNRGRGEKHAIGLKTLKASLFTMLYSRDDGFSAFDQLNMSRTTAPHYLEGDMNNHIDARYNNYSNCE